MRHFIFRIGGVTVTTGQLTIFVHFQFDFRTNISVNIVSSLSAVLHVSTVDSKDTKRLKQKELILLIDYI